MAISAPAVHATGRVLRGETYPASSRIAATTGSSTAVTRYPISFSSRESCVEQAKTAGRSGPALTPLK